MLACPRCAEPLRPVAFGRGSLWACERCEGRAATYPILRASLAPGRWKSLQRGFVAATAAGPRPCPGCRKPMLGLTFEGKEIETCRRCMLLWFDRGEAPAAAPRERLSPEAASALLGAEPAAGRRDGDGGEFSPAGPLDQILMWLGFPVELGEPEGGEVPWATVSLAALVLAVSGWALGGGLPIDAFAFRPDRPFRHAGATLVGYFFLHADWLHLFGNLYFLAVFGDDVERVAGWRRFLLLTLLGTVAGAILHAALDPRRDIPLVGASAGISALLAYYALRFPSARIGWFHANLPAWGYLAIWVAFQLLDARLQRVGLSQVSAFGHLGGAAVGAIFHFRQRRPAAP